MRSGRGGGGKASEVRREGFLGLRWPWLGLGGGWGPVLDFSLPKAVADTGRWGGAQLELLVSVPRASPLGAADLIV